MRMRFLCARLRIWLQSAMDLQVDVGAHFTCARIALPIRYQGAINCAPTSTYCVAPTSICCTANPVAGRNKLRPYVNQLHKTSNQGWDQDPAPTSTCYITNPVTGRNKLRPYGDQLYCSK